LDNALIQRRAAHELLDPSLEWSRHGISVSLPGGRIGHNPASGTTVNLPCEGGPELVMVQLATADGSVKVTVRGWGALEGHRYAFQCRLEGRYVPATIVDVHPVSEELHCFTLK
jgi:hypothetical protein